MATATGRRPQHFGCHAEKSRCLEGINPFERYDMPLDGKLVLRTYKEKPEEQEKLIKAKFKK
jgi:hypothetical protein